MLPTEKQIYALAKRINIKPLHRLLTQNYILSFLIGRFVTAVEMKLTDPAELKGFAALNADGLFEIDDSVNAFDLEFKEAIDFLMQRDVIPTAKYDDLRGQAARETFHTAGAMNRDLLYDLKEALTTAIASGDTSFDFKNKFEQIASAHGWSYNGTTSGRAKVIFATNGLAAYQAGKFAQYHENEDAFPYLQYRAVGDKRTRPSHMRLNGRIYALNDSIWDNGLRPPIHYNCRCTTIPLMSSEVKIPTKTKSLAGVEMFPQGDAKQTLDRRQSEYPDQIKEAFNYDDGEVFEF